MYRGIRNNNPANIKRGSNWKGLSPVQSDKDFCVFDSPAYGVRALICVLRTYVYKYKLNTISSIIFRFCPDNTARSYVDTLVVFMRRHMENMSESYELPLKRSLYRNAAKSFSETTQVCFFLNRSTPSVYLKFLCIGICWIESRYSLDDEVWNEAVSLL